MNHTAAKIYMAASVMLILGIFGGCGSGEYEQRLDKRIKELKTGSKFNILSSPTDVPGTQVSISVPQDFKDPPLKEGAIVDGKAVDPRRVKSNVIDLNDLKLTYEGFIEDANKGKQPFYLYVCVTTGPSRVNFPQIMKNSLAEKFNTTTELIDDYKAQTPEGREVIWKQCRATGNQPFYYVTPTGEGQFIQLSGAIELFFQDENETLITLVWRMPTGIEQSREFKSWMNMVAGCVKVK